jgi:FkbM family methyltransferase
MAAIREALKKIPLARFAHDRLREWSDRHRASRLLVNYRLYLQALQSKGDGAVVLRTRDGLNITIRQNLWDARVVREIFFDRPYLRRITLPASPVVVDIGGYIGDFSLYAVKYLNAERVIVYEPAAENFAILRQNVEANGFAGRIIAVNKAVSDSDEVMLNVQIRESEEVHVSAYWYPHAERRRTLSVTLPSLFQAHQLESVDLLKIDCEGGEYDILSSLSDEFLSRIKNIVFEYHQIDGFEARLDLVSSRLRAAGYSLRIDGRIVSASRA